uniref:Uncharacterized protein n=1 Tax=Chromera velia CCMP2878 TaxID=1169474 RepID=A0A0G4GH62_9ALVE|eukprot:Cvel_21890.t1-p1 / transcript=Cvel_21890.t1 / gene=Cvel_21890 / organism=Chromera_velia_CCMP2878 / gene_product=hypothetical protein / transcript_product=hypothetical protein / location=Cvel_scaffold2095:6602-26421(+) / protein_length=2331 / sequence_SO=supercontig / SO=protein_coding / is_pseudo=false
MRQETPDKGELVGQGPLFSSSFLGNAERSPPLRCILHLASSLEGLAQENPYHSPPNPSRPRVCSDAQDSGGAASKSQAPARQPNGLPAPPASAPQDGSSDLGGALSDGKGAGKSGGRGGSSSLGDSPPPASSSAAAPRRSVRVEIEAIRKQEKEKEEAKKKEKERQRERERKEKLRLEREREKEAAEQEERRKAASSLALGSEKKAKDKEVLKDHSKSVSKKKKKKEKSKKSHHSSESHDKNTDREKDKGKSKSSSSSSSSSSAAVPSKSAGQTHITSFFSKADQKDEMSDAKILAALSKRPQASSSHAAAAAAAGGGHSKHKEKEALVEKVSHKKKPRLPPQPAVEFPVEDSLLFDGNLKHQKMYGPIPKEQCEVAIADENPAEVFAGLGLEEMPFASTDLMAVYSFLRGFSQELRLFPFTPGAFVAALKDDGKEDKPMPPLLWAVLLNLLDMCLAAIPPEWMDEQRREYTEQINEMEEGDRWEMIGQAQEQEEQGEEGEEEDTDETMGVEEEGKGGREKRAQKAGESGTREKGKERSLPLNPYLLETHLQSQRDGIRPEGLDILTFGNWADLLARLSENPRVRNLLFRPPLPSYEEGNGLKNPDEGVEGMPTEEAVSNADLASSLRQLSLRDFRLLRPADKVTILRLLVDVLFESELPRLWVDERAEIIRQKQKEVEEQRKADKELEKDEEERRMKYDNLMAEKRFREAAELKKKKKAPPPLSEIKDPKLREITLQIATVEADYVARKEERERAKKIPPTERQLGALKEQWKLEAVKEREKLETKKQQLEDPAWFERLAELNSLERKVGDDERKRKKRDERREALEKSLEGALDEMAVRVEPLGHDRHKVSYWRFAFVHERLFRLKEGGDEDEEEEDGEDESMASPPQHQEQQGHPQWEAFVYRESLEDLERSLCEKGKREKDLKENILSRKAAFTEHMKERPAPAPPAPEGDAALAKALEEERQGPTLRVRQTRHGSAVTSFKIPDTPCDDPWEYKNHFRQWIGPLEDCRIPRELQHWLLQEHEARQFDMEPAPKSHLEAASKTFERMSQVLTESDTVEEVFLWEKDDPGREAVENVADRIFEDPDGSAVSPNKDCEENVERVRKVLQEFEETLRAASMRMRHAREEAKKEREKKERAQSLALAGLPPQPSGPVVGEGEVSVVPGQQNSAQTAAGTASSSAAVEQGPQAANPSVSHTGAAPSSLPPTSVSPRPSAESAQRVGEGGQDTGTSSASSSSSASAADERRRREGEIGADDVDMKEATAPASSLPTAKVKEEEEEEKIPPKPEVGDKEKPEENKCGKDPPPPGALEEKGKQQAAEGGEGSNDVKTSGGSQDSLQGESNKENLQAPMQKTSSTSQQPDEFSAPVGDPAGDRTNGVKSEEGKEDDKGKDKSIETDAPDVLMHPAGDQPLEVKAQPSLHPHEEDKDAFAFTAPSASPLPAAELIETAHEYLFTSVYEAKQWRDEVASAHTLSTLCSCAVWLALRLSVKLKRAAYMVKAQETRRQKREKFLLGLEGVEEGGEAKRQKTRADIQREERERRLRKRARREERRRMREERRAAGIENVSEDSDSMEEDENDPDSSDDESQPFEIPFRRVGARRPARRGADAYGYGNRYGGGGGMVDWEEEDPYATRRSNRIQTLNQTRGGRVKYRMDENFWDEEESGGEAEDPHGRRRRGGREGLPAPQAQESRETRIMRQRNERAQRERLRHMRAQQGFDEEVSLSQQHSASPMPTSGGEGGAHVAADIYGDDDEDALLLPDAGRRRMRGRPRGALTTRRPSLDPHAQEGGEPKGPTLTKSGRVVREKKVQDLSPPPSGASLGRARTRGRGRGVRGRGRGRGGRGGRSAEEGHDEAEFIDSSASPPRRKSPEAPEWSEDDEDEDMPPGVLPNKPQIRSQNASTSPLKKRQRVGGASPSPSHPGKGKGSAAAARAQNSSPYSSIPVPNIGFMPAASQDYLMHYQPHPPQQRQGDRTRSVESSPTPPRGAASAQPSQTPPLSRQPSATFHAMHAANNQQNSSSPLHPEMQQQHPFMFSSPFHAPQARGGFGGYFGSPSGFPPQLPPGMSPHFLPPGSSHPPGMSSRPFPPLPLTQAAPDSSSLSQSHPPSNTAQAPAQATHNTGDPEASPAGESSNHQQQQPPPSEGDREGGQTRQQPHSASSQRLAGAPAPLQIRPPGPYHFPAHFSGQMPPSFMPPHASAYYHHMHPSMGYPHGMHPLSPPLHMSSNPQSQTQQPRPPQQPANPHNQEASPSRPPAHPQQHFAAPPRLSASASSSAAPFPFPPSAAMAAASALPPGGAPGPAAAGAPAASVPEAGTSHQGAPGAEGPAG